MNHQQNTRAGSAPLAIAIAAILVAASHQGSDAGGSTEDVTPPQIIGVQDIVVSVVPGGTSAPITSYGHTAIDDTDSAPRLTYEPSGSSFPVGPNGVTCTATDAAGNSTVETFYVIVQEIQATPMWRRRLRPISLRGDVVPVGSTTIPAGTTILGLNHVFINNQRKMLIEASLDAVGSSGVGLFSADCDGLTGAIVAQGDPTAVGGTFFSFDRLELSDDCHASFQATTSLGVGHFAMDGTVVAAMVGGIAPGSANNAEISIVNPPSASNGGLFSPVNLTHGSGSPVVTAENDTAIWSSKHGGPVMLEGEIAHIDGLPEGTRFGQLFGPRMVSNQSGQIAFSCTLSNFGNGNIALVSGTPPNYAVVIKDGDLAPEGGGATIGGFRTESISESGKTMWRSNLQSVPGLVESYNNEALYTNRNGVNELVVREHSFAPFITPPAQFNRFKDLYISGDDTITFTSTLKGNAIDSLNDGCIWRSTPDGKLHLVAREGHPAPNTAGGILTNISNMAVNNTGGVAFVGTMEVGVGDVNVNNFTALFVDYGPQAAPEMVLRRGDTVEIAPGVLRTVLGINLDITFHPPGGIGGPGRVLNDHGDIVCRVALDSGSSGVFLITAPESAPAPLAPISSVAHTGTAVRVAAPRSFDRVLGVQYSPDLGPRSWTDIGTFRPDGLGAVFVDRDAQRLARGRGFYRAMFRTPPAKGE